MRACTASLFSSCEVEEETQIRDELTSPPLPDSGTGDDPNFEVRADYMKIRTLQPLPSYPQPRTRPRPTCPPEVRGYGWVQVWYRSNPTPTPRHQNFRLSTITAAAIILERPPQPPPFLHRLLRPTPRCLGFDSREMEVTAEDEAPKKSNDEGRGGGRGALAAAAMMAPRRNSLSLLFLTSTQPYPQQSSMVVEDVSAAVADMMAVVVGFFRSIKISQDNRSQIIEGVALKRVLAKRK